MRNDEYEYDIKRILKVIGVGLLALLLSIALLLAIVAGWKSFNRHQKLADANNRVKVTKIEIRNAQQQAKVVAAKDAIVQAQADQRFIKATGIKKAQDEIAKTLTPLYVQFEAIEAQKNIATSGKNNTVIYVPAGTNGTPIIAQDAKGAAPTPTPQGN
jgi:hypothetical protein